MIFPQTFAFTLLHRLYVPSTTGRGLYYVAMYIYRRYAEKYSIARMQKSFYFQYYCNIIQAVLEMLYDKIYFQLVDVSKILLFRAPLCLHQQPIILYMNDKFCC
jgi:hypothetical protein